MLSPIALLPLLHVPAASPGDHKLFEFTIVVSRLEGGGVCFITVLILSQLALSNETSYLTYYLPSAHMPAGGDTFLQLAIYPTLAVFSF